MKSPKKSKSELMLAYMMENPSTVPTALADKFMVSLPYAYMVIKRFRKQVDLPIVSIVFDTTPIHASPLAKQVDGGHYKDLKIQPIEFIHANNIPFAEGCAIKYLTRWRSKGGVKDLEKAKHFIELLIELESRK